MGDEKKMRVRAHFLLTAMTIMIIKSKLARMKGKKIIKNSNLFILRTFHYSSANDVQKVRSTDIKVSKILLNLTKFRYLYKKIKTIWENSLRNDSLGSHMLITKISSYMTFFAVY